MGLSEGNWFRQRNSNVGIADALPSKPAEQPRRQKACRQFFNWWSFPLTFELIGRRQLEAKPGPGCLPLALHMSKGLDVTAQPVEGLRQALLAYLGEGWRHLSVSRAHRYSNGQ